MPETLQDNIAELEAKISAKEATLKTLQCDLESLRSKCTDFKERRDKLELAKQKAREATLEQERQESEAAEILRQNLNIPQGEQAGLGAGFYFYVKNSTWPLLAVGAGSCLVLYWVIKRV